MSADIDAIKDALHKWVEAINARRADALSNLVSDDVVFIHPPAGSCTGKAAVARLYRDVFQQFDVKEQVQCKDIRIVGGLATARITEHIQLKPKGGGAVVDFTEDDALRFRRQSNGAWKLVSRSLVVPSPSRVSSGTLSQPPTLSSNGAVSSTIDAPPAQRQEQATLIPLHPPTTRALTAGQIFEDAGFGPRLDVSGRLSPVPARGTPRPVFDF